MHESLPPVEHFETVLLVARTGSIAAAARLAGRDASVLSKRLASLERDLGVRLFERSTRRLRLTDAGRHYVERVAAGLALLRTATVEAACGRTRAAGPIRVAVPLTFGRLYAAPFFAEYVQRQPGVRLDARFSDRYVDLIEERFDVAIRLGDLPSSGLVARRIAGYTHRLYAAPAYLAGRAPPAQVRDLDAHACIGYVGATEHEPWRLHAGAERHVVRTDFVLRVDDGAALVDAAVRGAGIALVADWLADAEVAAGRLVPVLPAWSSGDRRSIHVVTPSRVLRPERVRRFARELGEHLRRALHAGAAARAGVSRPRRTRDGTPR